MDSTLPSSGVPPTEKVRLPFILLAFSIFAIVVFGLIWLFAYSPSSPVGGGWFLFSFAAGLSMIVLPCTLPLAFVIVPLSMGKGYRKGLMIALAFGVGVTLMLSLYGLLTAVVGKLAIDSLNLQVETVKNWMYVIAGVFVIVFALTEIGLTKWRLPSYMGAAPAFIQKQGDYMKALMLGLFLGNIGIGCPSPATYVLLSRIATADDVFYGWLLFLVHGIGRVTPLIFLALLGIIGINATRYILQHKDAVERAMGWTLVFVGGFILALGLFGHDWYVYSGIHVLLEQVTLESYFHNILEGRLGVSAPHTHGVPSGPYLAYGSWVMVGVWVFVLLWYLISLKKNILAEVEPIRSQLLASWRIRRKQYITLILLLALIFGWALPHQFTQHWGAHMDDHSSIPSTPLTPQIVFHSSPENLVAKQPSRLMFQIMDPDGTPLTNLQLSHERILHAIIVSKDFSSFSHIHPDDTGPIPALDLSQSLFTLNYTFPKPGMYYTLLNFSQGTTDHAQLYPIGVSGNTPPPTVVKDLSREKTFKGYSVSLSAPDTILSGEEIPLQYTIRKDGIPLTNLKAYLAAPMHIAVFSLDFSYYGHFHGEIPGFSHAVILPQSFGPSINASLVFPWPGVYTIFGEFSHEGKVITTNFMVEVGLGDTTRALLMSDGGEHGHTDSH